MTTDRYPLEDILRLEKLTQINILFLNLYDKAPVILELEVLFVVIKNNGLLSQTEIKDRLVKLYSNLTAGHVSRYLYSLGEGKISATTGRREVGRGLIETRVDPKNYARKIVFLTPKGEALAKRIFMILAADSKFQQK